MKAEPLILIKDDFPVRLHLDVVLEIYVPQIDNPHALAISLSDISHEV